MKEILKKIRCLVAVIVVLSMVLLALLYITLWKYDKEVKKNKELKKQNECYQTLYNEDEIGNGCDKYFENDSWYIEYKKEVEKNM